MSDIEGYTFCTSVIKDELNLFHAIYYSLSNDYRNKSFFERKKYIEEEFKNKFKDLNISKIYLNKIQESFSSFKKNILNILCRISRILNVDIYFTHIDSLNRNLSKHYKMYKDFIVLVYIDDYGIFYPLGVQNKNDTNLYYVYSNK